MILKHRDRDQSSLTFFEENGKYYVTVKVDYDYLSFRYKGIFIQMYPFRAGYPSGYFSMMGNTIGIYSKWNATMEISKIVYEAVVNQNLVEKDRYSIGPVTAIFYTNSARSFVRIVTDKDFPEHNGYRSLVYSQGNYKVFTRGAGIETPIIHVTGFKSITVGKQDGEIYIPITLESWNKFKDPRKTDLGYYVGDISYHTCKEVTLCNLTTSPERRYVDIIPSRKVKINEVAQKLRDIQANLPYPAEITVNDNYYRINFSHKWWGESNNVFYFRAGWLLLAERIFQTNKELDEDSLIHQEFTAFQQGTNKFLPKSVKVNYFTASNNWIKLFKYRENI